MDLARKVIKQTACVTIPLVVLSLFVEWNRDSLRFLRPFGNPDYMTVSIVIGAILGIANLKGLIWGLESMLGAHQASAKLVFLSLFRLFILFAIIIALAVFNLINFLGLLAGMTVPFVFLIIEGLKMAQKQ
jgi:hypothetical protein